MIMKDFFKGAIVFGFFGFLALVVALFFYNNSHYRYRIEVPSGRYSTSYYTNAYRQRGECIYFVAAQYRDSSQVCGTFQVIKIGR
jgi:hypothetical protein